MLLSQIKVWNLLLVRVLGKRFAKAHRRTYTYLDMIFLIFSFWINNLLTIFHVIVNLEINLLALRTWTYWVTHITSRLLSRQLLILSRWFTRLESCNVGSYLCSWFGQTFWSGYDFSFRWFLEIGLCFYSILLSTIYCGGNQARVALCHRLSL